MTKYENYLKEKYQDKIFSCHRNIYDIIEYLNSNFIIADINPNLYDYNQLIENFKKTCFYSLRNKEFNYSIDELDIHVYEILHTQESDLYYKEYNMNLRSSNIYVIYDTKTGCINSNCSLLARKIFILEGISENDIQNNTPTLFFYLRALDEYNTSISELINGNL